MPSLTVREIRNQRPWSKDGGAPTVIYYDFLVEGRDEMFNIGRKPGNDLAVGQVIDGELESDGRGGFKVKATPKNGFGGGGPRPRDPKESAVIVQQHSQAQALRYCELQHARGKLPEDFGMDQVLKIAAKFAADAKAATP